MPIEPQNHKQAVMWYRKAAELGDAGFQVNLGLMYYTGEGVRQDFNEALQWCSRAMPARSTTSASCMRRGAAR